MKEEIKKIFKSFVDIFQMLDDFGAEEDKDALLEMATYAIIGILASEKHNSIFKLKDQEENPIPWTPYIEKTWPIITYSSDLLYTSNGSTS